MIGHDKLSKADIKKVIKLNEILDELQLGRERYYSITCLLSVKSLCKNASLHRAYCRHLFFLAYENLQGKIEDQALVDLIEEVGGLTQNYSGEEAVRQQLWSGSRRLQSYQNNFRRVKSNLVRMIHNKNLLVIEEIAASLSVEDENYAQKMIYQATRDYVETYDSSVGTGLTMNSIPMLEQVLEFWNSCR
jgi:hypothetical protein